MTYTQADYERERAICDKASAYAEQFRKSNGWTVIPPEAAKHPDYTACDNAMRGRVERYEILRDMPEVIFAYIGESKRNGMGVDRIVGATYPVTTWTGDILGNATKGATWRVNSYAGSHMSMFYARINGREYVGRGFGTGMCIKLKETAASKRTRA